MAEELALKLNVDAVNAVQSVKELKQMIIDASNEALKFEAGSKEFAKFSQVAALAKDKLSDVREQMALLDPDAKIRAFTGLGNAIVGGFTAAQGAAALFGGNVEDVQKALLKVQAAMALLQGFQAVQDGVKAFAGLRASILVTIQSMGAMKAALIGTGIGVFALAIGLLINQFNKLNDVIPPVTDEFTDHEQEIERLGIEYDLLTGKISKSEAALQNLVIENKKSLAELNKDTREKLAETGSFWDGLWTFIKTGSIKSARDAFYGTEERKKIYADAYQAELDLAKEFEAKKEIEAEKARQDAQAKSDAAFKNKQQTEASEMDWIFKDHEFGFKAIETSTELHEKTITDIELKANQERLKNFKWSKGEQLKFMLKDADVRIAVEGNVLNVLSNIGNLVIKNEQKQAAFQKKVAALRIIISQAEALAQAIKSGAGVPFPGNIVAIAASVAAIVGLFVGIKSLFSKAGDVGGAPSMDSSSVGSTSVSANVPSGVNFLNQPQTEIGGTPPGGTPPPPAPIIIENKILESDITTTQNSVLSAQAKATIG